MSRRRSARQADGPPSKVGRVGQVGAREPRRTLNDAYHFARGVNSIQLWFDGARWWVVTIFWESETPANPLPADLLRKP